jgi:hypothetical protein
MGDFVRGMHDASGLLSLLDGRLSVAEAEQRVSTTSARSCGWQAPSPETRSAPIARFWPATCRHSSVTFTIAALTSQHQGVGAAGTRASTTRRRPRPAIIARSPTYRVH